MDIEREIGDEFEVNGIELKVVEACNPFSCSGCYFLKNERNACEFQKCVKYERRDKKSVIFEKIYD